jgi:hypothetical protein
MKRVLLNISRARDDGVGCAVIIDDCPPTFRGALPSLHLMDDTTRANQSDKTHGHSLWGKAFKKAVE